MTSADIGAGAEVGPVVGTDDPLGPEWVAGADGLRFRRGARVLLLDRQDRLLLMRGHDVDEPGRSWWFTVGGGIGPAEDARTAAVREVHEETGLVVVADDLVGPVLTRSAVFDFYRQHCRQDEEFYVARVPGEHPLTRIGWTDVEHDSIDEVRWWPLAGLAATRDTVYPVGLADLVVPLLIGWDGVTRHLGDSR